MVMAALVSGRHEVKDCSPGSLGPALLPSLRFRLRTSDLLCLVAAAVALLVTGSHPSLPTLEKCRELPERFIFIFSFHRLG